MSDNIATLGLRIDANGFLTGTRQVERGLTELGNVGAHVEGKIKHFATHGAFALSSLASEGSIHITSVLRSLSSLGFAFGAVTGAVTLLGSSIIDGLITAYTKAREESKLTADALMADARRIAEYSRAALVVQLEAVMRQRNEILGKAPIQMWDGDIGPNSWGKKGRTYYNTEPDLSGDELKRLEELDKRYRELTRTLKAVEKAEALVSKKETVERTKDMAEAFKKEWESAKDLSDAIDTRFVEALRSLGDMPKAIESGETFDFSVPREDLEAMAAAAGKVAQDLSDAAKKWKEDRKQLLLGMGGFVAGALQGQGGVLGGIGNIGAGAISGIAGGPAGIAMGAFQGLMSSISGNVRPVEDLRRQMESFNDTIAHQLGLLSDTELEIKRTTQAFNAQKQATLELIIQTTKVKDVGRAITVEFGKLDAQMELVVAEIEREAAVRRKVATEDLEVRRLMALGRTEEAAAMELALTQERELAQARKDGMDNAYLLELAEVHRMEQVQIAMEKVQSRIASLTATIGGLSDFRNSLLLADNNSPEDRLAEARRQYEEILTKARGVTIPGYDGAADVQLYSQAEMQEAAARIPAAAQALLELSRLVNASGSGFQTDFAQVMEDTKGLIESFTEMRSVEEQMLAELKRIREGTETIATGGGTGGSGSGSGSGGSGGAGGNPLFSVMSEGFTQLIDRVDALATAVTESARETRRAVTALT